MTRKLKPIQKRTLGEGFFIVASLFLLFLLLRNPIIVLESVLSSLRLCGTLLIPSLFPLMAASDIAVESGAIEKITKPFSSVTSKILGVKKEAAAPYFLGLVGGYTTSVGSALSLYRSGRISKDDCERMIALSSLPSLSFLTSFVGSGVFDNTTVGWILWITTVLSTLILGAITQKRNKKECCRPNPKDINPLPINRLSPSKILVNAISHSASAMLLICACVVFFSTLIAALSFPLESLGVPDNIQRLILGSLEITNGVEQCISIDSLQGRASACALLIGWSGLSVHFQIITLCDGYELSFKKYFLFKALQGMICVIITLLFFTCFSELLTYK